MTRVVHFPYTRCRFGIAIRDMTPPVGIYTRSWGAAAHDTASGVHRPHTATAAVFAPISGDAPMLALVAVDIGWYQNLQDEIDIRNAVMQRTGLTAETLLINLSHTHGSVNANSLLTDRPGGQLIKPFLAMLAERIGDAVIAAQQSQMPAWITWGYGRCALAQNRDYFDTAEQKYACGYNPVPRALVLDPPKAGAASLRVEGQQGARDVQPALHVAQDNPARVADDTLLVARVSDDAGHMRATLFNYACHPTTLAWQNHLLSPDYIGAAREVLERAFGAPTMFLQGALGDVAPRDNYVGDVAVADRNGRQLGYAAAATLEGLPPAGHKFVYTGIVPSGADLGAWEYQPCSVDELKGSDTLRAYRLTADLQRKEAPAQSELRARYDNAPTPREREIALRRMLLHGTLGDEPVHHMPLWVWRLGDAALVAIPNEPYNILQQTLRQKFSDTPLMVLGTTNGTLGYLPPKETYGKGIYQEQQSPYAAGCMEKVIEVAADGLAEAMA